MSARRRKAWGSKNGVLLRGGRAEPRGGERVRWTGGRRGVTRGGWWGEPEAVAVEVPAGVEWSEPAVRSSNTQPEQDHFPENETKRFI